MNLFLWNKINDKIIEGYGIPLNGMVAKAEIKLNNLNKCDFSLWDPLIYPGIVSGMLKPSEYVWDGIGYDWYIELLLEKANEIIYVQSFVYVRTIEEAKFNCDKTLVRLINENKHSI